jgi:hypothetical protein
MLIAASSCSVTVLVSENRLDYRMKIGLKGLYIKSSQDK